MSVFKPILFVTFLVLLATAPRAAVACTCVPPPGPLEALSQSDAVFSGKVLRIYTDKGQYGEVHRVQFDVDAYWKGEHGAQLLIETATNSAACGFNFEEGKQYLVYGFLHDSILRTNICTRTAKLSNAQEDLTELGEAAQVVVTRSRCGGPTNAAALQAFIFLFAGMFLSQRKSRK